MKASLMDILACPIDKYYPLKLVIFEEKDESVEKDGKKISWREIVHGIIICDKCNRWYPIEDEIPEMLPDDLREKDREIAFLNEWKEKIPKEVLMSGKPFNLSE
ncbi:MAG: Trm112 family protein [Candidatus Brockarchaeota archaeon]|nr:Trm112 family protein [Candidatus Brockarchaeota archaeon]